jgi:hypothetical protein
MKKHLLILLLLSSVISFAQVRFGIKAGGQRTAIIDAHNPSTHRMSIHGGGLALLNLSNEETFYIQGEANFVNFGESSQVSSEEKINYYFTYFSVPILFKSYFSEAESEFFLELGPQFSYLLMDNTTNKDKSKLDFPQDDVTTNKFDIAAVAGLGFSFQRKWELGARMSYGFSDVYPEYESVDKRKNRTSSTSIYLNYIFD